MQHPQRRAVANRGLPTVRVAFGLSGLKGRAGPYCVGRVSTRAGLQPRILRACATQSGALENPVPQNPKPIAIPPLCPARPLISWYDMITVLKKPLSSPQEPPEITPEDYRALGSFRYHIRRFMHFSEEAARHEGLEPQQHQMMLAIKASAEPAGPDVTDLAEHLMIRHHSAVGLVDRLAQRGYVERVRATGDRRVVRVRLTADGERRLKRLSGVHREELRELAPLLVDALSALTASRHA
jgi:DNA-binding MarR family transcriptional regulator